MLQARFFVYEDKRGVWYEMPDAPTAQQAAAFRDHAIVYDALEVEKALGHYKDFFEKIGEYKEHLPEFLREYYNIQHGRVHNVVATPVASSFPTSGEVSRNEP